MKKLFSQKLIDLAEILPFSLYAVGGVVRDFLIDGSLATDIDICSPCSYEEVERVANSVGIKVVSTLKRTGTAVLYDGERSYEFTSFRKDVYSDGGFHTPDLTVPTTDIIEDALRRDFKCNAVYYDIKRGEFVDPIGGVDDIKNKRLSAVKDANEVFSHDGLRLLRLARFSGELNFTIDSKTLKGAKENCDKIKDISKERIYAELNKILVSDNKHPFSDKKGHYNGLKVLEEIGVLEIILPELYLGKGMKQRSDYHNYDVLEHSLRATLYAEPSLRLYALLHDIGKPFTFKLDGNFYAHAKEGEEIVASVLRRLKAPNEVIKNAKFLTRYHMLQTDEMREGKLRLFIAENFYMIDKLIGIKRADFMALKDNPVPNDYLKRLISLRDAMLFDGTPLTLKGLNITAKELEEIGVNKVELGKTLKELRVYCILNPKRNEREKLIKKVVFALKKPKND